MRNKIIQGDALTELKKLKAESIDCVMTSPPYWALRDYGVKGQLGLEPTFDQFINNLCDIFDEVKRVLKKEGTCWVNIGDTYYTKSGSGFIGDNISGKTVEAKGITKANELRGKLRDDMRSKSLVMIPFRFAIEMVNRGWILRNTIIWHKPNCMPSSAKDRFTVDFEYLFFFSKSKKYWFERQFEELSPETISDINKRTNLACITGERGSKHFNNPNSVLDKQRTGRKRTEFVNLEQGRNKRTVWKIPTQPFPEAHFAVYPEKLCETPIKSGCPKEGVILDPFMGAGTTAVAAKRLGRDYLGIELNPEYIKIAEKRLKKAGLDSEPLTDWLRGFKGIEKKHCGGEKDD